MKKWAYKCTCGDVVPVDADTREEAVEKIKGMMGADAIAKHMAEKHAGDPVPSVEDTHAGIEAGVYEVGA